MKKLLILIPILIISAAVLNGCRTVVVTPGPRAAYYGNPYYVYGGENYYYSGGRYFYYRNSQPYYVRSLPRGGYYWKARPHRRYTRDYDRRR